MIHPTTLGQPSPRVFELGSVRIATQPLIKLKGKFNGVPVVILLDCGGTGLFVSSHLVHVNKSRITTTPTDTESTILLTDGTHHKAGTMIRSANVTIGTYTDQLDFVVCPLVGFDLLLGMPWFAEFQPCIDWRRHTVSFDMDGERHVFHGMLAPDDSVVRTPIRTDSDIIAMRQQLHHSLQSTLTTDEVKM